MGEKSIYMDYYDVKVGMTSANGVVMSSDKDEKSWMIDMEVNRLAKKVQGWK
jgi:hypothetical protein